jgi:repressor LexA
LNNYLSGQARPGGILQQRLRVLGCDVDWLMTGRSDVEKRSTDISDELQRTSLRLVPVYTHVKAGTKSLVFEQQPIDYVVVPRDQSGSLFALKVKGNSMSPKIEDGDIIIVSQSQETKNDDICFVVFEDGESCIRYVHCFDHEVMLSSANNDKHPPIRHKKTDIRWFYKVVGFYRPLNKK